ncbi:MAG: hypoxanthine phosphoribosyltransferase [Parasporobacterium sp.]|nr:hypoxanthine phosphoribosyltransferase [Parasporobacterium sp.]
MNPEIEVLISEKDVRDRIKEMAAVLSEKYAGKDLFLIGILNGSVFFLTELAQNLALPVEIDFMQAASYGAGTVSSGNVIVTKDLDRDIEGRHVLIVEDIVDTGRTLKLLVEMLKAKNPASLEVIALLDKPERRVVDFQADYVGFSIPDAFAVGWGLDYDQKYRDLTFVGVVKNQ